jgi:hypothetical protein
MSWTPISNTVPQYEENGVAASGFYIKFYESGTITPTAMAIDNTGVTTLDKCELNTEGYPINGSGAVFIPHIDQKYKILLYRNETDADNNTFSNKAWEVDLLFPFFTTDIIGTEFAQVPLNTDIVYPIASLQNLAGLIGTKSDQQVNLKGWHAGWGATLAGPAGGGILSWDDTRAKSSHNGGTIFSPTVPYSATTADYLNAVGETDGAGTGCWVRLGFNMTDVKWFGAKGDRVTIDESSINACKLFTGNGSMRFSDGRYLVNSINFDQNGGTYIFDNAAIVGGASSATDAVVEITGAFMSFQGTFFIDADFNTNYGSAAKWHSAVGAPAQYNTVDHLKVNNALVGLLYGQFSPIVAIDQPQSENFINTYTTFSVEVALYNNQRNGYLAINGGAFGVSKGGWDANSPGSFDFADARVVRSLLGTIALNGCELIATESQTTTGLEITGGSVSVNGGIWEIAGKNLRLGDCNFVSTGVTSAYTSSSTVDFIELINQTSGTLKLTDLRLEKATGTDASIQGFLGVNSTPGWDVSLSVITANRQQRTSIIRSTYDDNTYLTNIKFNNFQVRGSAGDVDISNSSSNLLDTVPTQPSAVANQWHVDGAGTVSEDTSETPTVTGRSYPFSIKVDSASGSTNVGSMDRTSAATIKETGMRVTAGKQYIIEGWVKRETGGSGNVSLSAVTVDGAGGSPAGYTIASESTWITEDWVYVRSITRLNATAQFMGIGINVTNDIGYFIDLKVSRVD